MTSSPDKTATPDADRSAAILTDFLDRRLPFFFVRYGDGAIECMWEPGKRHTCDGEDYSKELAVALKDAWEGLATRAIDSDTTVFAGDWQTASFGNGSGHNQERERWAQLVAIAHCFEWLHFESLLLMRESKALVEFYRAVKRDKRRKVYMGPAKNAAAARFLGAFHLVTPMVPDLIAQRGKVLAGLDAFNAEVVLYGAGMAGNVIAVDAWKRNTERTYISLGSALDPLFSQKSRAQQLSKAVLRAMFRGML